jgi:hypothetical protein
MAGSVDVLRDLLNWGYMSMSALKTACEVLQLDVHSASMLTSHYFTRKKTCRTLGVPEAQQHL